jgi:hypothetical protein
MEYVGNTEVTIKNGYMEDEEIKQYISYLEKKFPEEEVSSLTLTIDGEHVDISYTMQPINFERIRRITGYLVGTLDRFNDAKASEEAQRVKHNI